MSQSTKRRDCPAAGRALTAPECGEHRHRRYACPADCTFNPFSPAQVRQLAEFKDKVDAIVFECARATPAHREFEAALHKLAEDSVHAFDALYIDTFFVRQDESGRTWLQRHIEPCLARLRNDGRILLQGLVRTRIAVIEVHRVLDGLQVEVVDLLEEAPVPFIIAEPALAECACRFDTYLCWIVPLPHYCWLSALPIPLSNACAALDPLDVLVRVVRHLGGPTDDGSAMKRWISSNYRRMQAAIAAAAAARSQFMRSLPHPRVAHADYSWPVSPSEMAAALDAVDGVEQDTLWPFEQEEGFTEARLWFEAPAPGASPPATSRSGHCRLLLEPSHCRLEAVGLETLAHHRRRLEQQFGRQVRFLGESLEPDPPPPDPMTEADAALVPPDLRDFPPELELHGIWALVHPVLSGPERETDLLRARERSFIDQPLDLFQGRTPRQAALDPSMRPTLLRLMKLRVRTGDVRSLRTGKTTDFNGTVRELGLDEIVFDPPPPRKPPVVAPDQGPQIALQAPPRLPASPLTMEDVHQRLRAFQSVIADPQRTLAALEAAGSPWIEASHLLLEPFLKPREIRLVTPTLAQLAFVYAPPGTLQPRIEMERIQNRFIEAFTQLSGSPDDSGLLAQLDRCSQPILSRVLASQIVALSVGENRSLRISEEMVVIVCAYIAVAIEEFERASRLELF